MILSMTKRFDAGWIWLADALFLPSQWTSTSVVAIDSHSLESNMNQFLKHSV